MSRTSRWQPPTTPFTFEHVAPLGVTRAMIHAAASSGRITRLAYGVYISADAVAADPVGGHLQRAQALQLGRPQAIASHHTAALAWNLALDDPVASAISPASFIVPSGPGIRSKIVPSRPRPNSETVPPGTGARSEIVPEARIAVRVLPQHHRAEHPSGLLVTAPARTAVDVASTLPLPEALMTLDSAARLELQQQVGSSRLRDHYSRPREIARAVEPLHEAATHAATQFTRNAIGLLVPIADPRRETALESLSFGHMVVADLPLPELQVRLLTPEGEVFPDFLWAAEMVIGEADGLGKYRTEADLHREKRRQELLEQMGYRIVRWTYREMRERPNLVLRRIEAALDARRGAAWA
ncbi:MAG: DUF559 domain-containing protein [Candidatus Nanopelagicales bacterium]